jgi:hypothetical protein
VGRGDNRVTVTNFYTFSEEIGTSVRPSPGTSVSGVYGGPGEDVQHHVGQGLGQGGEE